MNINITIDLLRPDRTFVLMWLRPDQRSELVRLVQQASYDDLKRLDGNGGGDGK